MALIVEDGSIVAGADSYNSLVEITAYNTNYVNDSAWTNATTAEQEVAARQATQFVDSCFGSQWIGVLSDNDQSLDWPRSGAVGTDGRTYDDDVIPLVLKDSISKLSITAISEELSPDQDNPGTIKKTKDVVAVLSTEIEYFSASQQKQFTTAQKLLDSLLQGGSGQLSAERS